jgi:trehalose 6-phosphate synthase/phosphatase
MYYYRSVPVKTLSALYNMADICLVTPMRDGMNLVCKEYVASRTGQDGVLILSEMAGAAKELVDSLTVNPNNIGEIYRAIIEGLNMPPEEQKRRMQQLQQAVSKFNVSHWVKIYRDYLKEVKQVQISLQAKHVGSAVKQEIEQRYRNTGKRVLFLDYDGTLVGFSPNINAASPDAELYDIISQLSANPANLIVLISGRDHQILEKWFGHLPIDIIGEHGAWQKKNKTQWQAVSGLSCSWKQELYPVLETFADRTPGSFIEEKTYSLVWHYRRADKGLGELRANELINNLNFLTTDKPLQVLPGNKIVEIKNIEINKGKAALTRLEESEYDFILAMGDDHTDEDIFKALPKDAFTIKIGGNVSAAKYYLWDFREVRMLLRGLIKADSTVTGY